MEQNSQMDQEKREERRKRRRRNQIVAYVTLFVMIAVVAVGVVFGVKFVTDKSRAFGSNAKENQAKLDELLESEESIPAPPESSAPPEITPEQKLDEIVNAGIEVMPLEDKVAGLFMVAPESITGVTAAVQAGEGTQTALAKYAVGGIVYFDKNMETKEQLTEMIDNTVLYSKYPLFIAVDEEGGTVSRIGKKGLADPVDSAQAIGKTADANNAYLAGTAIGGYLKALGFNLDFAPVADLSNVANSIMKERAYASDAASAIPFVTSMIQGLKEQGITSCLKHFPGIGSSVQDTHDGLASTDKSAEAFRADEFTVFQAGIDAGADMVMIGHMAAPALTGDNTPCSMSKAVITDILRTELNFKGVIISDAMNMGAITEYYESDEAAIMALKAGCDMVLMPDDFEKAYNGVLQAVQDGTISEERVNDSLRRIYRIKYADKLEE